MRARNIILWVIFSAAFLVAVTCCSSIQLKNEATHAVDDVIEMLEAGKYREMIERYTLPETLSEMKKSGKFEKIVARFEKGWGRFLLEKLRKVRNYPVVVDDETVEFWYKKATLSPLTGPITLKKYKGKWYFLN